MSGFMRVIYVLCGVTDLLLLIITGWIIYDDIDRGIEPDTEAIVTFMAFLLGGLSILYNLCGGI